MRKTDYKITFRYKEDKKDRHSIFPSDARNSREIVEEEFRAFRKRSGYTDAYLITSVTKARGHEV